MSTKELCLALMEADTATEVIEILRDAGYWDDTSVWRVLGDNPSNFSTIGNQQAEPVAALIEKVVNSIDARLTNACQEGGIHPEAASAPRSIREAVARFFEKKPSFDPEKDGRISMWENATATTEGRLLTITATGNKPNEDSGLPSISVADQGEGQTPDDFSNTFMSLHQGNKAKVHFVQGKFNMGGTGALQFCAQGEGLQLVVSRRNPALLDGSAFGRDAEWGFTIVRREEPDADSKNSVFTYLASVEVDAHRDGAVLSFASSTMPIFPEANADIRSAYARESEYGTLIKLYEYEWSGTRSNIVSSGRGLLRRIDAGMPELGLPVRMYEARPGYSGHAGSFSTNVLGLAARLERDRAGKLEEGFPLNSSLDLDGSRVVIRTFAFKKGEAAQYRTPRQGVIFTVNGQAHASFPQDFFTRKAVAMSYLKGSLLVLVDCSEITGKAREGLFMNSRDRLRNGRLADEIEEKLEELLRTSTKLKDLRNERRQQAIEEELADSKPLSDAFRDLLSSDPTLKRLFLEGLGITAPFKTSGAGKGGSAEFEGKTYPTYFHFKKLKEGEVLKRTAELNRAVRLGFETNALDDYFTRDLDRGTWGVYCTRDGSRETISGSSMNGPEDGIATLNLKLPDDVQAGDNITIEIEVTDPSRVEAFVNIAELEIVAKTTHKKGPPGDREKTATKGKGSSGSESQLALPKITLVTKAEWDVQEPPFTGNTAVVVKYAGEADGEDEDNGNGGQDVYDFFVNVDNVHLKSHQKNSKKDTRVVQTQFVNSLVLIGLSLIRGFGDDPKAEKENGNESEKPSVEDVIEVTTRAVAAVILPIVERIGSIGEEDVD